MSLCLTRRRDESVILYTSDGPIRIAVSEITRNHAVQLAISAPASVKIVRQELEELARVARKVLL